MHQNIDCCGFTIEPIEHKTWCLIILNQVVKFHDLLRRIIQINTRVNKSRHIVVSNENEKIKDVLTILVLVV